MKHKIGFNKLNLMPAHRKAPYEYDDRALQA